MRQIAFDIETARILPSDARGDLLAYKPLGITCAALAFDDGRATELWQAAPRMSREHACLLVGRLQELVAQGYQLVTWNGCSFDFQVLADESGLTEECGALALAHTDLMLYVTFCLGYRLKLDAALKGAGLAGKSHCYVLADGREVDPSGAAAPQLWAQGEYDAVLHYLRQDVEQLLALAERILQRRQLRWTSARGYPMELGVRQFLPVRDCFHLPLPDTSWMSEPPTRRSFVAWIPHCALG